MCASLCVSTLKHLKVQTCRKSSVHGCDFFPKTMRHTIRVLHFGGRDRRRNAALSDRGLQQGASVTTIPQNTHRQECTDRRKRRTHESLAPRRLSNIVSVLFFLSLVFFLCSYLVCGKLFQLTGAAPKLCLPASITMLQVTRVRGPQLNRTTSGSAQTEKCECLTNRHRSNKEEEEARCNRNSGRRFRL